MNGTIHKFIEEEYSRNYDFKKYSSNWSVSKKADKFSCACTGRKYKNGVEYCKMHHYYCDYGEAVYKGKHDRNWKRYRKTQYKVITYS